MPTGKPSEQPTPQSTVPTMMHPRLGAEDEQGEADDADRGDDAQHRHAAEAVEQRAAEHAGGRHRHGEDARRSTRADRGVEAVAVDDGEGEPVVAPTLGERHAEHDDADEEQSHVAPDREARRAGARSTARRGAVGVRVVAELARASGTNRTR